MRWLIGSATECSLFEVCVLKLLLVSCDGVDLITSLDTIWMLCEQVLKLAEFASVIAFVERSHIEEAYICINNFIPFRSTNKAMLSCFNRIGVLLCSILDLREKRP